MNFSHGPAKFNMGYLPVGVAPPVPDNNTVRMKGRAQEDEEPYVNRTISRLYAGDTKLEAETGL